MYVIIYIYIYIYMNVAFLSGGPRGVLRAVCTLLGIYMYMPIRLTYPKPVNTAEYETWQ
jgi:hypothetical protein